ncbi:ribosome small subunit-dependent GTPase A [Ferrimonas balearica]|uniref:ribosome small subunit-dependent GTPase A n=1 Tax=Ferrimonas balearica TaxID=44012 RepID=UPI001C995619|nr:ribosome small subunit-dependent GTPase A [Ferrimonas balearica]MBY5920746.1 ribosome small subunit-dependent GTPase A [Ferrimonas balearica]MBY5996569.1 ribosome small subunit-dependent GTPase A [Ferrimonas balearica]
MNTKPLPSAQFTLAQLGWKPFYQQQLSLEQWDCRPARVMMVHRNRVVLLSEQGYQDLSLTHLMPAFAVGDWVLLTEEGEFATLLERQSLFRRRAAGPGIDEQLIAANIDTLLVVSSCNDDFNLNRLERYLALAYEAEVEPVVVLTKADLHPDPEGLLRQVQALDPLLMVVAINALDAEAANALAPWCSQGRTVALMGSSGVGKSTLINTLLGGEVQSTAGIREDDSKGRHTTTGRSLHPMVQGGLLLDTPGMRELQLTDCEQGVNDAFAEITAFAAQCRFGDCQHENEPGCAVRNAVEEGTLSERRLASYRKLMREQAHNSATLAEKRFRDKAFGKHCRLVQHQQRALKGNR